MKTEKKTIHQLYVMFNDRFNVDQISNSIGLQTLYGYLANQNKRADGHFVHDPSDYIKTLIKAHLGYENPSGMQIKTFEKGELKDRSLWKERCRSCFWMQTCTFLEYDQRREIINCNSFKTKK